MSTAVPAAPPACHSFVARACVGGGRALFFNHGGVCARMHTCRDTPPFPSQTRTHQTAAPEGVPEVSSRPRHCRRGGPGLLHFAVVVGRMVLIESIGSIEGWIART